ncbi:MAG: hypothetical protein HYT46_00330 [Candidatus Vogelbacteria bacterium]|nr:hypothetical protein [Candidatus Vogelbacteria bacterium]
MLKTKDKITIIFVVVNILWLILVTAAIVFTFFTTILILGMHPGASVLTLLKFLLPFIMTIAAVIFLIFINLSILKLKNWARIIWVLALIGFSVWGIYLLIRAGGPSAEITTSLSLLIAFLQIYWFALRRSTLVDFHLEARAGGR